MKYRKKPLIVEAIRWNGNTALSEVEKFMGYCPNVKLFSESAYVAGVAPPLFTVLISTKEGTMEASPGDWIIKGVHGEFYPCKPDIFEKTYEKVDD